MNDKAGHAAGDALLREVAEQIRLAVRPSDLTARFGGDEFVVLLPELGVQDAMVALERVRMALQNALALRPFAVTVHTATD